MSKEEMSRSEKLLSALLAISVDQYLRETGIARPKVRSIDRILTDIGLSAVEIAAILGKTERAVYKQLASEVKISEKENGNVRTG